MKKINMRKEKKQVQASLLSGTKAGTAPLEMTEACMELK
jgi:hypothetical protein